MDWVFTLGWGSPVGLGILLVSIGTILALLV